MIAGLVLSIVGVALGLISMRQRRASAVAEGGRLMGALDTSEDAQALVQLSQSPFSVRRAFLEQALSSDAWAEQLLAHQHALSVALSRIDFGDARRLYEEVLRGRLLDDPPASVIEASTLLLARWDLVPEVRSSDAAAISARMAERMEADAPKGGLERYAPVLSVLAPRLTAESADALTVRLFNLGVNNNSANGTEAVAALGAIAARATVVRRRELATRLIERLSGETRRQSVMTLARMLTPLSTSADESAAAEISAKIVRQIVTVWESSSIDALLPALRSVAPKTPSPDAERDARLILGRIDYELQPAILLSLTNALNCFGDRIPREIYQQTAESLLKRIRVESNEGALVTLTASLGALNHKASKEQFTAAAENIVSRFAGARDMTANAALAGAIDAVADELDPPVAERLSSMLVARMLEERQTGSLLYIATGLASIADEVEQPGANALSGRLLTRLLRESNPPSLRTLAFSMASFIHASTNADAAARVLSSRIAEEDDPDDVRQLASGLYALRDKAGSKYLDQAAGSIAQKIGTRMRPDDIAKLAVSLNAMAGKAGPEPYERAAAAIVANADQIVALEPALALIAPAVREPKARELVRILAGRVARKQDPATLRALGNALAAFPEVPWDSDAAKLLRIPDAPCQIAPPQAAVLNPLCSEASWLAGAEAVLRMKPPPRELIAPDFAQLAADDDDDAPASDSDREPVIDFRKLSAALTSLRARRPIQEESATPWAAIVLLICGVASLAAGAAQRT